MKTGKFGGGLNRSNSPGIILAALKKLLAGPKVEEHTSGAAWPVPSVPSISSKPRCRASQCEHFSRITWWTKAWDQKTKNIKLMIKEAKMVDARCAIEGRGANIQPGGSSPRAQQSYAFAVTNKRNPRE